MSRPRFRDHRFCRPTDRPHINSAEPVCFVICQTCRYTRETPNCPPSLILDYTAAERLAERHRKRHPGHDTEVYWI